MSEKKNEKEIVLAALLVPPAELQAKWSSGQVDLVLDDQLIEIKHEHDEDFCCWRDDPCEDHR